MTQEQKAHKIIAKLCQNGYQAYLVGGVVRDSLMGIQSNDYDVVTNAKYEVLEFLFSEYRINCVGKSFKVAIIDGIEVAQYRKDTYFGGSDKNCEIQTAKTIHEDLARRDLTINSMAFCPYTGELIDPYNGKEDLKNKVIRFTGNPYDRINEDPCRILRACRFLAKIQGTFHIDTLVALQKHYTLLKQIPMERINLEVQKVLVYDKPSLFFDALRKIGALRYISPTLYKAEGIEGGQHHNENVSKHLMLTGDAITKRKPLLRLAGYLHDVGKILTCELSDIAQITFIGHENVGAGLIKTELNKLKFSASEINYVSNLTKYHMRPVTKMTPKGIRRLLRKFQENNINWKDWVQLHIADRKGNLAKEPYTKEEIKDIVLRINKQLRNKEQPVAFSVKDLAINGKDVMRILGIDPGIEVGRVLNYLLECVLENPELNTFGKLECLLYIKLYA